MVSIRATVPRGTAGVPVVAKAGGTPTGTTNEKRRRSCGATFEGTTIRYVVKESMVTGWPVKTSTRDTWSG